MTDDVIKKIVKDGTYVIINSEFINEFKSMITNIKDILLAFNGKKQIISYQELIEILSTKHFSVSYKEDEVRDSKTKITLLYELGFLGFSVSTEIRDRYGIKADEAFYFNENEIPLKILATPMLERCRFVIHPIFCEYLQLDTSQHHLTLNFNWDYLREMDSLLYV